MNKNINHEFDKYEFKYKFIASQIYIALYKIS